MSESIHKEVELVRKVFGTPDGQELLKMWTEIHVMSGFSHENPAVMAHRVATAEFVISLCNVLKIK